MNQMNERVLSWARAGLAIAIGLTGMTGCTMDVGEEKAGPGGEGTVASLSEPLTAADVIFVDTVDDFAMCPPDHPFVVGGGLINFGASTHIDANAPLGFGMEGWRLHLDTGLAQPPITAEAMCLAGEQPRASGSEVRVNAFQSACGVATCPSGTVVTGGGYFVSGHEVSSVYRSRGVGSDSWEVCALGSIYDTTVYAYAQCVSSATYEVREALSPLVRAGTGVEAVADAVCPEGSTVSSNGFLTSILSVSQAVILESDTWPTPSGSNLSRLRVRVGTSARSSASFQSQALCISTK